MTMTMTITKTESETETVTLEWKSACCLAVRHVSARLGNFRFSCMLMIIKYVAKVLWPGFCLPW